VEQRAAALEAALLARVQLERGGFGHALELDRDAADAAHDPAVQQDLLDDTPPEEEPVPAAEVDDPRLAVLAELHPGVLA